MAGQLNLFKGRRQRGTSPPPPREFVTHRLLAETLKRWGDPRWRYTHLPFGEKRPIKTALRLKQMGVTPGWPDFVFCGPNASVFWLELKRLKGGRMSPQQADIASHLVACGFSYLCTNSLDDAVATLKQLGILRANIEVQ